MKRAGGGFDPSYNAQTAVDKAAYRRRKWIAEPPNGWIKSVLGFRQFSPRGIAPRASRVQARLSGAELAARGQSQGGVRAAR